jgi:hypothetical protein
MTSGILGQDGCSAVLGPGKLDMLIAHGLNNLTDPSLAAQHHLANSVVTEALLEHLDNPSSAFTIPDRAARKL